MGPTLSRRCLAWGELGSEVGAGWRADPTAPLTASLFPPPVLQMSWLASSQTAQKEKPFLYTSGFPVLNRSFFPGFHTPGTKSTYSARVQVKPRRSQRCLLSLARCAGSPPSRPRGSRSPLCTLKARPS